MGDAVIVQGLVLLGLYDAAIAKARGARLVVGLDTVASRRDLGAKFGVDHAFDASAMSEAELAKQVRALCKPEGADVVFEVCGHPEVIPAGIRFLRNGGRYVLAGVVNPDSFASIDWKTSAGP